MPGKKRPFLRTAFAKALQSHMQTRRGDIGKRPPMWEEWTEGIHPNYRGLAGETRRADSVKLHSHISALISSQAELLCELDGAYPAWFALCLHDRNPDIPKHREEWTSLLPDPSMAPCLPASEIVSVGEAEGLNGWAEYMRERYQL